MGTSVRRSPKVSSPGSRCYASSMKRTTTVAVLATLCACSFGLMYSSMRLKSLTFDELSYIPAGYSYVASGDFRLNHEQPPLMKLIAGLGMLPLHPRLPLEHESWSRAADGDQNAQWAFGREFLGRANPDVERVVRAARTPVIFVTLLLIVGTFLFARELYGSGAGLLAAALCAFDPNILAHGRLATTDLGLACFVLWAVWGYLRLSRSPSAKNIALAGVLLGLALLTKFSALFLLALYPIWAIALPLFRGGVTLPGRWATERPLHRVAVWAALTGLVVLVALFVVSLGYFAPGRADIYFRDFRTVQGNVNAGYLTYFAGAFHRERVPQYFVAAFLLKAPLAFLLLLAVRPFARLPRKLEGWPERLLLLSPVLIWFAIISWKAFQIGIRYVLPAYPFLFVYASGIVASPWFRQRGVRAGVGVLLAWLVVSSVAAYPDYLPYFNEFAGGPSGGIEWLDDSNVDWGQDLILVRDYLVESQIGDAHVTPMARYDIAMYGVPGTDLPPHEAVRILSNPDPPPGVYAVSAHLLNRAKLAPDLLIDPLVDLEPTAVLGHTIYVFDLRE